MYLHGKKWLGKKDRKKWHCDKILEHPKEFAPLGFAPTSKFLVKVWFWIGQQRHQKERKENSVRCCALWQNERLVSFDRRKLQSKLKKPHLPFSIPNQGTWKLWKILIIEKKKKGLAHQVEKQSSLCTNNLSLPKTFKTRLPYTIQNFVESVTSVSKSSREWLWGKWPAMN